MAPSPPPGGPSAARTYLEITGAPPVEVAWEDADLKALRTLLETVGERMGPDLGQLDEAVQHLEAFHQMDESRAHTDRSGRTRQR